MAVCPVLKSLYQEGAEKPYMIISAGIRYIRGNSQPYFTITGKTIDSSGCMHNEILKKVPSYRDLVEMHGSHLDGTPVYPVENGYYHYGGTSWHHGSAENLASFLRISVEAAEDAMKLKMTKEEFTAWVDTMRPRWNDEAKAIIEKYKLEIFGDVWNG